MSDPQNPQSGRQLDSLDASSLLRPKSPPSFDPIIHAQKLAVRSRYLCTVLAMVTVLVWIVACFMAIMTAEDYPMAIWRQAVQIEDIRVAKVQEEPGAVSSDQLTDDEKNELEARRKIETENKRQGLLQGILQRNQERRLIAEATIALFGLAAMLSIWLTIASRRVALRQVNANLLAITTELKKLLPEEAPQAN